MSAKLYLTNYSVRKGLPVGSITRLPKEEAFKVAKELAVNAEEKFTSFSRFRDFEGYYAHRVKVEKWLYEEFIASGGEPEYAQPIYFVLGKSDYLKEWFDDGEEVKIPLDAIDPEHISFTYGDSMSVYRRREEKSLLRKQSLLEFITSMGKDIETVVDELNQQNRYIEVQLWKDNYVEQYLNAHKYKK